MRKVTYGAAASLDGYIAGPAEEIDWLRWSKDAAAIAGASWQGVDTMLMGRKTYDFAVRSGGGSGAPPGIRTYVFSRSMTAAPKDAELVREEAAGFVRALKQREGGGIIVMGGGALGSALIEGGVVDEIGVSVHPILLGGGIPLFRPIARRVDLRLIECRAIANDCVFLRYSAA
jgi:dihydrofolate reductase